MKPAIQALKPAITKKTANGRVLVTGGPQLWISCLLHNKGALSTNRIWEEFIRDNKVDKNLFKSKTYLKEILNQMQDMGKLEKTRARDMP